MTAPRTTAWADVGLRRDRAGNPVEPDGDDVHDCDDGWMGEDATGRPRPCPACKPHAVRRRRWR